MKVAMLQEGVKVDIRRLDEECSRINHEVPELMRAFRSHANPIDGGVTWPAFYEMMQHVGFVVSPENENADAEKGKPPRDNILRHLNAFMLGICASLRPSLQKTCSLRTESDLETQTLTHSVCD